MATKEQQRIALACRLLGESKALAEAAKARDAEAKQIINELIPPDEKGTLESRTYGRIVKTFQERLRIDPSSEGPLRSVLGDRFADYVSRSVALKPTAKIKELLSDADSVVGQNVRAHVEIKVSPVVKFEPAPGKTFPFSFSEEEPAMAGA